MKLHVRIFLLLLILLSACSTPSGKAASNPTETAVEATAVIATGTYTAAPTQTSSPSPTNTLVPSSTPTASPSPSATSGAGSTAAASPQPTPTPFPAASPTALPLPTQVNKEPATPTPGGPPTPTPVPPTTLLDQYLPRRVKVAETAHFIFYAQDGYFPVDQAWWTSQAEEAYAYVSARLDHIQVKHKISVAFRPPNKESCPIRGLAAESGSPMIIVFADQNSSQAYLLAVLSHEVGHAINYDGFPEGLAGNIALAEGLASYGSGKYWVAWQKVDNLDDLVRGYLKNGTYESISENTDLHGVYPWQKNTGSSQNCLARRDKIYSEWADFEGYLIHTYGWPKAHQIFRSPNPIHQPGQTILLPSDYPGVYGKTLNQLEWEWLNWLQKGA